MFRALVKYENQSLAESFGLFQIHYILKKLNAMLLFDVFLMTMQCKKKSPSTYLACLHDQNKRGFFEGPAFIQPIRAT